MFGRKQLTSVYIVDDNSDAIEVLRRMLESQYSVKVIGTSTDADTAIEEIIQLAPDLIFTDVEMPTMTGIQLCQLLHQEVDPNTKVVFYTGHDKYMIDAIRQKAFDYLLKPPSPQDLAQTMTRFYEDKLASLPQAAGPAEQRQPRILVVNAMNEHIALRDADVAFSASTPTASTGKRYAPTAAPTSCAAAPTATSSCVIRHRLCKSTSDISST